MGRGSEGFSVVELLCAMGMALIVSQIAIPSLQQNRIAANEAAAIASLRVHAGAAAAKGMPSGEEETGYRFLSYSSASSPNADYVIAVPVAPNRSGVRSYCLTGDGVLHVDPSGATPSSEASCRALAAAE